MVRSSLEVQESILSDIVTVQDKEGFTKSCRLSLLGQQAVKVHIWSAKARASRALNARVANFGSIVFFLSCKAHE